nr:hypothetical protein [Mycobacterium gordonae]
MTRRRAVDQAAREERIAAIRRCRRCDPCGWQLGPDRIPIEPAVRCAHSDPPHRDYSAPVHEQPDLYANSQETDR